MIDVQVTTFLTWMFTHFRFVVPPFLKSVVLEDKLGPQQFYLSTQQTLPSRIWLLSCREEAQQRFRKADKL